MLSSKSIAKGDSASLIWTVRSYKTGDSLQASQTFNITVVRMQSVGLNETSLNALVKLYPNPTKENTILSMQLNTSEEVNISIVDVQGKTVTVVNEKGAGNGIQEIELPTASLQNGIYFVRVSVGGKSTQVKLVVMH